MSTRLCKDCRWAKRSGTGIVWSRYDWACLHESSTIPSQIDPVEGGMIRPPIQAGCAVARNHDRNVNGEPWCGPEGRFWEPREWSGVIGFGEALDPDGR